MNRDTNNPGSFIVIFDVPNSQLDIEITKYLSSMLNVDVVNTTLGDGEHTIKGRKMIFKSDRIFKTGRKHKLNPEEERQIYNEVENGASYYSVSKKWDISPSGARAIFWRIKNDTIIE